MKIPNEVKTIEISNFGGNLTRKINGDLNSGLAKFSTSFGYDPFSKPENLTWFEAPVDISGSVITDLIVAAKPRFEVASSTQFIYALGSQRRLYKISPNSVTNPNLDTASIIGTLSNSSANFGASMEFYGATEKIYLGLDDRVTSVNFDGSGEATVGTVGDYTANRYRPLSQFIGKLIFGNGTNIGAIDSTGTVVSSIVSSHYEQLSPSLPPETNVTDIDISVDGNYLNITASGINNENILTISNDRQAAASSNGNVYFWNGIDLGVTAYKQIPSYAVTALQTYLDNNLFFSDDSFGASVSDGSKKILTLPNNKSPFANSTAVNGNFLTWVAPELTADGTSRSASLYYFGQLDENSPKGLWRVCKYMSTLTNGFIYQSPVNLMTNNKYSTVNTAVTSIVTLGYGKHYFSAMDINSSTTKFSLQRFLITSSGTGTPQLGVYETQTQLFSKRVNIVEIRVYTEPTVSGNGFKLDIIGSDGLVVANGSSTYTYAAGTDITQVQGSLERITFGAPIMNLYAIGIRITNTGTTNMTIKKVEVDVSPGGK